MRLRGGEPGNEVMSWVHQFTCVTMANKYNTPVVCKSVSFSIAIVQTDMMSGQISIKATLNLFVNPLYRTIELAILRVLLMCVGVT